MDAVPRSGDAKDYEIVLKQLVKSFGGRTPMGFHQRKQIYLDLLFLYPVGFLNTTYTDLRRKCEGFPSADGLSTALRDLYRKWLVATDPNREPLPIAKPLPEDHSAEILARRWENENKQLGLIHGKDTPREIGLRRFREIMPILENIGG